MDNIFKSDRFIFDIIKETSNIIYRYDILEYYIQNFIEISKDIIDYFCYGDSEFPDNMLRYIKLHKISKNRKIFMQITEGERSSIVSTDNLKMIKIYVYFDGTKQNLLSPISRRLFPNSEYQDLIQVIGREAIMSEKEYAKWKLSNG